MVGAVRKRLGSVAAGHSWLALLGIAVACAAAAIILLAWRPATSTSGAAGQSIVRALDMGFPEAGGADDTVFGTIARTIVATEPVADATPSPRPSVVVRQPTPTAPSPTTPVTPPTGGTGTPPTIPVTPTPTPPVVRPPAGGGVVTVRPPAATVTTPLGSVAVAPGSVTATLENGTVVSVLSAAPQSLVSSQLLQALPGGEITAEVNLGDRSISVSVPGVGES